jgi:hypothetical protein
MTWCTNLTSDHALLSLCTVACFSAFVPLCAPLFRPNSFRWIGESKVQLAGARQAWKRSPRRPGAGSLDFESTVGITHDSSPRRRYSASRFNHGRWNSCERSLLRLLHGVFEPHLIKTSGRIEVGAAPSFSLVAHAPRKLSFRQWPRGL